MIYNLKYKEFTKLMKDFGKTVYGKAMLVICFTPFMLSFIICCILSLIPVIDFLSKIDVIIIFLATIILLCIGCYAYYNQLRIFAEQRKIKE